MKRFFSYLLSGFLGAFFVVLIMIGFDRLSTVYPFYVPNIFYKEKINYTVDVHSQVSEAIEKSIANVVQVNNYSGSKLQGSGSGVIYKLSSDKAYIVTNFHVINGTSDVEIETGEGYRVFGDILGSDNVTDLAVIAIPRGTLNHYMEFSDSQSLKVGEYVIAIGNPLGLSGSATLGIVSSKERLVPVDIDNDNQDDWYASVLQTDAPINPGNSGGALINLDGKLIGINSMKIAQENVEGIGFSIPSKLVSRIISEIEINGKVNRPERILGVSISRGFLNNDMVLEIIEVVPDSLAERSDLRPGDVIIRINHQKIVNIFDLKYYMSVTEVNKTIDLTIIRDNGEIVKTVTIAE